MTTPALLQTILTIWQDVLKLPAEALQPDSNFFYSGGDSLRMLQVLARVRQRLGLELKLQDSASFSTPQSMARWCVESAAPAAVAQQPQCAQSVAPEPSRQCVLELQSYPASANQQGIWLAELFGDGAAIYNIALSLQLDGQLNVPVLEQALTVLLQRHVALRSRLRFDADLRQLLVHTDPPAAVKLRAELATDRQARTCMRALAAQPFDLANGELWRFQLFRPAVARYCLFVCIHHSVSDGWSGAVLMRNLAEMYNALLVDAQWQPQGVDSAHAAYAREQQQLLANPHSGAWQTLEYWRQRLAGADQIERLFDTAGTASPYRLRHLELGLPPRLMQALADCSTALGVTRFTLMLAAFRLSLLQLTGVREQCIGIPVASRETPEREQSVGCYLNLLVARTFIDAGEAWDVALRRMHAELLRDIDNLQLPFREVLAQLQPGVLPSGNAWFDVLFAFQNLPQIPVAFTGLQHSITRIRPQHSPYMLEVEVTPRQQGCDCQLAYAETVLSDAVALQLAEYFVSQLWRLCKAGSV